MKTVGLTVKIVCVFEHPEKGEICAMLHRIAGERALYESTLQGNCKNGEKPAETALRVCADAFGKIDVATLRTPNGDAASPLCSLGSFPMELSPDHRDVIVAFTLQLFDMNLVGNFLSTRESYVLCFASEVNTCVRPQSRFTESDDAALPNEVIIMPQREIDILGDALHNYKRRTTQSPHMSADDLRASQLMT